MSTLKVDTIESKTINGDITVSSPLVGDGSGLTSLPAANLTGALPALDGSSLTGVAPTKTAVEALGIELPAANLTGSVPSAALGNVDLTAVRQDIAMLALYNAVSDNRAAYNLPHSFVDQFEDDTGVTTQTTVDNVDEYFASVYSIDSAFTSDANTNGLFHMDDTGLTDSSSNSHTTTLVGNTTRSSTQSKFGSYSAYFDGSGDALKLPISSIQFGTGTWTVEGWFYPTNMSADTKYWTASSSHSSGWNNPTSTGAWTLGFKANGAPEILSENGNSNVGSGTAAVLNTWTHVAVTHASGSSSVKVWKNGSLLTTISVGGNYSYGMVGGQPAIGVYDFYQSNYRSPYTGYIEEFRISNIERYTTTFTPNSVTSTSATGTLISDTQTAPSATTKMSGVILYKDNAGTATLGTDLVISLSANGGTNYTEAASYGTVTPLFSTGVKMVRLGETTVTSGSSPVIKAVWANQASGSKETQLHGWAVNY
jgi:hypothetical protein